MSEVNSNPGQFDCPAGLLSHCPVFLLCEHLDLVINNKILWIKDLNVRPETIKLLDENIGKTFSDIHHSRILYDPPPRKLEIKAKINKWDSVCSSCSQGLGMEPRRGTQVSAPGPRSLSEWYAAGRRGRRHPGRGRGACRPSLPMTLPRPCCLSLQQSPGFWPCSRLHHCSLPIL